jgi:hypothetical protein
MKKQILIALLFSVAPLSFGHSLEVLPSPDGAGFLKTEWLEKIYQANRLLRSAEIWYNVLGDNGALLQRRCIAWDPEKKRLLMLSMLPVRDPSMQAVASFSINDGKRTIMNYWEKRTPDLSPSDSGIKKGNVSIGNYTNDILLRLRVFFIFDEDFGGNQFCNMLKTLSPEELRKRVVEVKHNGKECLKFSGPVTFVFEKERGIVLEKTIYHAQYKEMPPFSEKIEYADHQIVEGIWFPMSVRFTVSKDGPNRKEERHAYRINPEDVKLNHKIPEEKFTPRIPKGIEVYDHANDLHYISTGFTRERENSIKKQLDEIFEESEN